MDQDLIDDKLDAWEKGGTPQQPTYNLKADQMQEAKLADNILEDGQHQDLEVRPARGTPEGEIAYNILNDPEASRADLQLAEKKGKYEVVIGKRRWNSAKAKNIQPLDVSVRPEMTDLEALDATLENEWHKSITDFEKGKTYKTALEKFPQQFPTQQSVADHYHVDKSEVSHLINHYEYVTEQQKAGCPNITELSEKMVRIIRGAPKELQTKLFQRAARHELTEREAQIIVEQTQLTKAYHEEMMQTLTKDAALKAKVNRQSRTA